jgi:putative acetyltransferase
MSRIRGFHQDEEGYWVADLDCGHAQHMRHDPPWRERAWVMTESGRCSKMGGKVECRECSGLAVYRLEKPVDVPGIRMVNELAFEQPDEADIVDRLRESCDDLLSLVAVRDQNVVGHILFSPVTLETREKTITGTGLAPMGVRPGYQRQGIGSDLVRAGLALLFHERQSPFVIVLGHPEYYPRFGFEPASKYGVECQWEGVPDEAFMIRVRDGHDTGGLSGVARYRDEFDAAM